MAPDQRASPGATSPVLVLLLAAWLAVCATHLLHTLPGAEHAAMTGAAAGDGAVASTCAALSPSLHCVVQAVCDTTAPWVVALVALSVVAVRPGSWPAAVAVRVAAPPARAVRATVAPSCKSSGTRRHRRPAVGRAPSAAHRPSGCAYPPPIDGRRTRNAFLEGDDMTTPRTATIDRRRALRLAGALAGLGIAAVAGPALAQQTPGMPGMGGTAGTDHSGMMGGMPGMMQHMQGMMGMMGGLMGGDSDRLFIQEMIGHHQGAVAMAAVAWQQAEHREIKQITEQIAKAQNEEIEQMARWYRAWFNAPVPPGQMPLMMARMGMTPDALSAAKPADKAFLEMMSMHHQMAVMMAGMALPSAQHDELAKAQERIVDDQAKEIAQMRTWRRAWYGT